MASSSNSPVSCVVFGDPHFKPDYVAEIEVFIEKTVALALKRHPDFIVCLGDLLHTHEKLHTLSLNQAGDWIHQLSEIAPTFLLVGNHDYINAGQFLTGNHPFNAMKKWNNVTVVDKPVEVVLGTHYFVMVPYVPKGRFVEALGHCRRDWTQATAVFCHQEILGGQLGGGLTSTSGDAWDPTAPFLIGGHLHEHHRPQNNVLFVGAPWQIAYGDGDRKTVGWFQFVSNRGLIQRPRDFKGETFSFDRNIIYYTRLRPGLPCKRTVKATLVEAEEFEPNDKEQIRLVVRGSIEGIRAFRQGAKAKELNQAGVKLVFDAKDALAANKTMQERLRGEETDHSNYLLLLQRFLQEKIAENKRTGPLLEDFYYELLGEKLPQESQKSPPESQKSPRKSPRKLKTHKHKSKRDKSGSSKSKHRH